MLPENTFNICFVICKKQTKNQTEERIMGKLVKNSLHKNNCQKHIINAIQIEITLLKTSISFGKNTLKTIKIKSAHLSNVKSNDKPHFVADNRYVKFADRALR